MHHSSKVTVPCDFKSFKKQANLSCRGTSYQEATEESEEENTWAVGAAANTDSPTKQTGEHLRSVLSSLQTQPLCYNNNTRTHPVSGFLTQ